MNGELAPPDEGMSYVEAGEEINDNFLFNDAIEELQKELSRVT